MFSSAPAHHRSFLTGGEQEQISVIFTLPSPSQNWLKVFGISPMKVFWSHGMEPLSPSIGMLGLRFSHKHKRVFAELGLCPTHAFLSHQPRNSARVSPTYHSAKYWRIPCDPPLVHTSVERVTSALLHIIVL